MKKFWIGFTAVVVLSFVILGWVGVRIYQEKPPVPSSVVTENGTVMLTGDDIELGKNVWQSLGGMEIGSVWGHGSYVAPDWTADYLHRESIYILDSWSVSQFGKKYDELDQIKKAALSAQLTEMIRKNTYNEENGKIIVDSIRVEAFRSNVKYYSELFSKGHEQYAIPENTMNDPEKLRMMTAFFFWTSWSASTNRPNDVVTYTNNWPHEKLIANEPTSDNIIWTGVSLIVLLAGIGLMVYFHASNKSEMISEHIPSDDPLLGSKATPSQLATLKYFWVVGLLILVQIFLGIITAHYGVEGKALYGIKIDDFLPYVVTRTWHTQIGIFWIATAWLAAGLYIAPAISGTELKFQKLGVNILFIALLIVVSGSLVGEWLSVKQKLSGDAWFYFGHQGYEYVDLGRFWQILLLAGLLIWLYLVGRNIVIALRKADEQKPLVTLFFISAIAIAGFYAAGLMWGKHTNLAMVEYWRWWVVHLWVEGFFEIFATVVIAFLFAKLGLIRISTANKSVVLSSTVFLSGGIIGTLHHLYFSGTPTLVIALGAVFSALEVVPLVLVGFEAYENLKLSQSKPWVQKYKWPIYFFIAVAFWNAVGAGLFGFMINPPIALYYMQGLNTTPVHGHAALFGVYGMLGMGLLLFCLRGMFIEKIWYEKGIQYAFWLLNIGLFAMVTFSLLPVGLAQTWASVEYGYWYARSAEFLYTETMQIFKWSRVFGDTLFSIGIVLFVWFVLKFRTAKEK